MRLTRLKVAELRQFRQPFELAGLQPGLNLLAGPNEAGKSTLVRAIRAAFFERHRSTSVDDLRPWGDSAATPSVELDFEIGGTAHRLTKSFLGKKRCELVIGTRRLEGAAAEDELARLLGFQFAAKGASREEHWGIPGLLWVEQGAAQDVAGAVRHAADHLRQALDASAGAVAASGGDDVLQQVQRLHGELLTDTGKPRAALQKAHDDAATLAAREAELAQAVAQYRGRVDRLATLRAEHAADAAEAPWAALRCQQADAERDLQAADALAGERAREHERHRQETGLRTLLADRVAQAERQRAELAQREAALADALQRHEQDSALEAQTAQAEAAAAARWHSARDALARARQEHTRSTLARQAADAQARAAELAALLQRANAEHERSLTLRREAAQAAIATPELTALRRAQQQADELRIRRDAVATRLRVALLPGASVQLDGETLHGETEHRLTAPARVDIPGVGSLHIAPGGSDLADLAQQHAQVADELAARLQRLGLASVADAEARAQAHARLAAEATAADKACALLAPKGLDALRTEHDAAHARHAEATAALAALPPAAEAPPLDAAERQHDAARADAEAASQRLQAARQQAAATASRRDAARHERDALQAALDDPQAQAELAARRRELVEAGARADAIAAALQGIDARIAAARPDILKQTVERYRRSADEAERAHQAREREIVALEAELAAAGAQGLEEELARVQVDAAHARRRAAELQRRADALAHLLAQMQQRRQAGVRALQAPLQRHLDRYLTLLFPEGRLHVDEALVPGTLTRGTQSGAFDAHSFGAREQMGVLARLAYADLLRDAGRPTLLILDDALVHSDAARLALMKRAIFDAAQRHQVLLFTCHPALWRDMGVAVRALDQPSR